MGFFSHKQRRENKVNRPRPHCRLQVETLEDRCVPTAGMLDPTFGTGGFVTNDPNLGIGSGRAVLVQPDGKMVVAADPGFTAVRYNPDGSLDSSFGSGGVGATAKTGPAAYVPRRRPVSGGDGKCRKDHPRWGLGHEAPLRLRAGPL